MEKSKSFPQYSSSLSGEFGFDDRRPREDRTYSFNGPNQKSSSGADPEAKRKKRIAAYNVFTMEGKLKSSVRNSFKWIKTKLVAAGDSRYGI